MLGLRIEWNCDLDRDYSNCKPRYSARRLDDRNAAISPGFNFRYDNFQPNLSSHTICRFASTWIDENGIYHRQLTKAYGIRVNINVIGEVAIFYNLA